MQVRVAGSQVNEPYADPTLYLLAEESFRALVQESAAGGAKCGVAAFHFQRYKEISESKSPDIAEHLLLKLATLLRSLMRPGDTLGRLGPDSLALLLVENFPGAVRGAQRLLPLVARDFRFTVRVGLSHCDEPAQSGDLCAAALTAAMDARGEASLAVYSAGGPLDAANIRAPSPRVSAMDIRYQRLSLLHRISLELFSEKPFEDSMAAVGSIIMALMGCKYVSLYYCDDFGRPVPAFRCGESASAGGPEAAAEVSILARAWTERRCLTASAGALHWRAVCLLPRSKPGPSEDGVLIVGYPEPQTLDEESDKALLAIRQLLRNARLIQKNQEQQKTMVAVTEQSADAIFVTDLSSQIILWNPAASKLFRYDREEILGRGYLALIPPQQVEEVRRFEKEALTTGGVSFETAGHLKGGALIPLEVSFTLLRNEAGFAFGMVGVLRDITRRKELERMQGEFVSLVSHELRTPLTSIQGFTETILDFGDTLKPAQLKQYLGIILSEAQRLGTLVTNFLDISKLESGEAPPNCRELDFRDLAARVERLFREHPSQAVFDVHIEPGAGNIYADEDQLYRILVNLCGNALKYTPAKGTIRLSCRRSADMTEVCVADQGPGIPLEHQRKIFDRFYRVSDPISQKTPGTGLGLAICKGIVNKHGGEIWVESAPGQGTSFKFTLRRPPR